MIFGKNIVRSEIRARQALNFKIPGHASKHAVSSTSTVVLSLAIKHPVRLPPLSCFPVGSSLRFLVASAAVRGRRDALSVVRILDRPLRRSGARVGVASGGAPTPHVTSLCTFDPILGVLPDLYRPPKPSWYTYSSPLISRSSSLCSFTGHVTGRHAARPSLPLM